MPDTDAAGYARTIQGEHAHKADSLRRDAQQARDDAASLENQAEWHEERAKWAGEMAEALEAEEAANLA